MNFSLKNAFSDKNINLVVGLFSLFLFLWIFMFAVPGLFVTLFDTGLGNLVLITLLLLSAMYNTKMTIGLAIVFMVLYRFSHMSVIEPIII